MLQLHSPVRCYAALLLPVARAVCVYNAVNEEKWRSATSALRARMSWK